MPRLHLDLGDSIAQAGRGRLGIPSRRLGQQADGGQRSAQLVRQVVDEFGADPLQAAQLRHVLKDEPHAGHR